MRFIIDKTYLVERTTVNYQKDESSIRVAFNNVDFFYLRKVLTSGLHGFFTSYANTSTTNPVTLTVIQLEAYKLAQYYFALMVHWDLLAMTTVATVEIGPISSERLADLAQIKERRNELYNRAEQVKSELLAYINNNRAEFEQYYPFEKVDQNQDKVITNGTSPIVFVNEPQKYYGI